MVSCIMPTRGRREWASQAVQSFLKQTYPAKQLVILDDIDCRSFDEPIRFPENVEYLMTVASHPSIPDKRNYCCEVAAGEIIVHWDSDDYSEPTRIADQVHLLEESQKQVAGFHSMLFHVEQTGQAFKYQNDKSFALGTSLCFSKSFWAAHPFRPGPDFPNVGEDNEFVKDARNLGELISVDAGRLMVARIHDSNTSVKRLDGAQTSYVPVSVDALPRGFFQK